MNDRPELWLHEEVLLLALKDEKGTPHSSMFTIAMGGAILADLLLSERFVLEEKPRKKPLKPGKKPAYLVAVDNPKPLTDPVLDECRVAVGLCRKGILREREDRILVLFRRTAYPTLDGAPERRVVDRLQDAVAGDSLDLDARTAVMVALANGTGILKHVLGKDLVKQRKDRIKEIGEGDIVGEATKAAVEAAQAAVIAATTAASVAATTAAAAS
jgi:hypothetical protein